MTAWAAPLIGLPFGEGPGQVTCWSLVRRVYADRLGILLPAYGEVSATDLVRIARAMRDGSGAADGWRAVDRPAEFDVVLMRGPQGGRAVVHVGVMAGAARVLHVEAASHAVLVPLAHWSLRDRILGYRRHACRS
ncbi:MAG TPA: NlpC/P60 family protein [Paracoccaceae bacterium]|nr:NlpC/P60 family protein [Paracoccaceae bacterium]